MTKLRKAMAIWTILVVLVMATIGLTAFAQFSEWVSSDILVRNFTAGGTNRVSSEIMTILGKVSNRQYRLIFDGGPWTINSSIGFPTNVSVAVARDCYFNISAGNIVTFSNNVFDAGPYQAFAGIGSATGAASFLYRWTEWGDVGRFNIGSGVLGQAVSLTQSFTMVSGTTGTFQWVVGGTSTLVKAIITTSVVDNAVVGTSTLTKATVGNLAATTVTISGGTATLQTVTASQFAGGTVDVYRVTANEINSENGGNFRLDPTTNASVTFTTADSYATIQNKISSYNRFVPADRYIVVQFGDGEYFFTNAIVFEGFYGGGTIYVRGNQSETGIAHTNQAVIFTSTNYNGNCLELKRNSVGFEVDRIKFQVYNNSAPATNYNAGVWALRNSDYILVQGCSTIGQVTNFGYGFRADYSVVASSSNVAGTVKSALHGRLLAGIYNRGSVSTGAVMYGIDLAGASYGSSWGDESSPTGTVANVYTNEGGIWPH